MLEGRAWSVCIRVHCIAALARTAKLGPVWKEKKDRGRNSVSGHRCVQGEAVEARGECACGHCTRTSSPGGAILLNFGRL